jgi:hypothetical protein
MQKNTPSNSSSPAFTAADTPPEIENGESEEDASIIWGQSGDAELGAPARGDFAAAIL